jgi:Domain of unknown function (DUF4112)
LAKHQGTDRIYLMPVSQDQFAKMAQSIGIDSNNPAAIRKRVEALEMVLERSFVLPIINKPVGLDFIVGLIPGIGDFVTAAMGAYMIWEARNLGMSKWQMLRMAGNLGFDTLIGAVPLAGDAVDLFFRSNTRNLRIIKKHLDKHHPGTRTIDGQSRLK